MSSREPRSPGWDAIDAALAPIYPGEPPFHYGTVMRWRLGGRDPLDGISVYVNPGPPEHWHFVTYGLSELYEKESSNAETSGWGIELTFRLTRSGDARQPPVWALNFLQNLARYIFDSGNVLLPNHTLDLNGPIALDSETEIRAVCFVEDRQLGSIATPHGSVQFVQVVGLTLDEYRMSQGWSVAGMTGLLASADPLLVTDLARQSILSDPEVAGKANETADVEGSSMSGFNVSHLEWWPEGDCVRVEVGALIVDRLEMMLVRRCALGRDGWLWGPEREVQLAPADEFGWEAEGDTLSLRLPAQAARDLAAELKSKVGRYAVAAMPRLVVDVRQTVIRDQDGNVTEVVG